MSGESVPRRNRAFNSPEACEWLVCCIPAIQRRLDIECHASYSIAAAFRMQTIVAEASFCDTLRIACGRSHR